MSFIETNILLRNSTKNSERRVEFRKRVKPGTLETYQFIVRSSPNTKLQKLNLNEVELLVILCGKKGEISNNKRKLVISESKDYITYSLFVYNKPTWSLKSKIILYKTELEELQSVIRRNIPFPIQW